MQLDPGGHHSRGVRFAGEKIFYTTLVGCEITVSLCRQNENRRLVLLVWVLPLVLGRLETRTAEPRGTVRHCTCSTKGTPAQWSVLSAELTGSEPRKSLGIC